jgi:uncharacterized protein YfaA (DUF2138 family)
LRRHGFGALTAAELRSPAVRETKERELRLTAPDEFSAVEDLGVVPRDVVDVRLRL